MRFASAKAAGALMHPGRREASTAPVVHWDDEHPFLLDVRQPAELAVEQVPGVVNIPLRELRARLDELPRDREIHVICRSGQRAYYATRILLQNGFEARNISGGMLSHATLSAG
jgi:rhodanese-related sulfurtransferase